MRFILIMMIIGVLVMPFCTTQKSGSDHDYPFRPVSFTEVKITDGFWSPRLETNRTVTVPYDFKKSEETGRIDNFAVAGGLKEGEHIGRRYNDSDVFKIMEGAAFSLAIYPDPELDKYMDDLISKVAASQKDDGYLYTMRTINPDKVSKGAGESRWSYIAQSHELYNVGHMYEAAVAHYQATGKKNFLDVAIKSADLIDSIFGPGKRTDPPGHQEIEIGLAKLYRVTGDKRYLNLARFFLDQRGHPNNRELYGDYSQDHLPVIDQSEAVGHAVRAGYMYSGMADIAALSGDKDYINAIDRIWENIVYKKLYITGGIGARHSGEAFGDDYELPNLTAYNETCAAIANIFFNHRLFLLHGDSKYIDVLERTLYNGFLSGISFSGDEFFYPNPLESDGRHKRSPWFDCSCCPSNIVRFLPSLPGYIYAHKEKNLYVNLYIRNAGTVKLGNNEIKISQETDYPWDGHVKVNVNPEKEETFTVFLRIPGWAQNQVVPGDLYRYLDGNSEPVTMQVNGKTVPVNIEKGFARLMRKWKKGDYVNLEFPMNIRRVISNEKVKDNTGKVSLERGPVVYCAEWVDNKDNVRNLLIPDDTELKIELREDLLNGIVTIRGSVPGFYKNEKSGKTDKNMHELVAIPYYSWAHRGAGEMTVWFPRDESYVKPLAPPTAASKSKVSASYCFSGDIVEAVNNRDEPKNSNDQSISRFTWWDHKGTEEWIRYDFEKTENVSSVEVFWFDDGPDGGCRIPGSWSIQYKKGDKWLPVENAGKYDTDKDKYNSVNFKPVNTDALRLNVKLQKDFSGGILEWRIF
ncbi:glycoside hydrolase family 127 protein [candidate division KSB1 bacterium]